MSSSPIVPIDVEHARHLHKIGQAKQLHGSIDSQILKAAVYGANDGIITTFSVVAGVAGAGLSPYIVLILGIANLLADGLAMGIGDYLGARSELTFKRYQYAVEEWEIANIPEQEKIELEESLQNQHVEKEDAKKLSAIIQKYPKLWATLGFIDEMGSKPNLEENHVWHTGVATFFSFALAGFLPLLPYFLHSVGLPVPITQEFFLSIISTAAALFLIGSLRTIMTKGAWWRNGIEMLSIGAIAAIAAYIAGAIIKDLVH